MVSYTFVEITGGQPSTSAGINSVVSCISQGIVQHVYKNVAKKTLKPCTMASKMFFDQKCIFDGD